MDFCWFPLLQAIPGRHRPSHLLPRYPYLVFYVEHADHIDVWRVLHGQRDIPAWMREPERP